jgi:hypothetical protein
MVVKELPGADIAAVPVATVPPDMADTAEPGATAVAFTIDPPPVATAVPKIGIMI